MSDEKKTTDDILILLAALPAPGEPVRYPRYVGKSGEKSWIPFFYEVNRQVKTRFIHWADLTHYYQSFLTQDHKYETPLQRIPNNLIRMIPPKKGEPWMEVVTDLLTQEEISAAYDVLIPFCKECVQTFDTFHKTTKTNEILINIGGHWYLFSRKGWPPKTVAFFAQTPETVFYTQLKELKTNWLHHKTKEELKKLYADMSLRYLAEAKEAKITENIQWRDVDPHAYSWEVLIALAGINMDLKKWNTSVTPVRFDELVRLRHGKMPTVMSLSFIEYHIIQLVGIYLSESSLFKKKPVLLPMLQGTGILFISEGYILEDEVLPQKLQDRFDRFEREEMLHAKTQINKVCFFYKSTGFVFWDVQRKYIFILDLTKEEGKAKSNLHKIVDRWFPLIGASIKVYFPPIPLFFGRKFIRERIQKDFPKFDEYGNTDDDEGCLLFVMLLHCYNWHLPYAQRYTFLLKKDIQFKKIVRWAQNTIVDLHPERIPLFQGYDSGSEELVSVGGESILFSATIQKQPVLLRCSFTDVEDTHVGEIAHHIWLQDVAPQNVPKFISFTSSREGRWKELLTRLLGDRKAPPSFQPDAICVIQVMEYLKNVEQLGLIRKQEQQEQMRDGVYQSIFFLELCNYFEIQHGDFALRNLLITKDVAPGNLTTIQQKDTKIKHPYFEARSTSNPEIKYNMILSGKPLTTKLVVNHLLKIVDFGKSESTFYHSNVQFGWFDIPPINYCTNLHVKNIDAWKFGVELVMLAAKIQQSNDKDFEIEVEDGDDTTVLFLEGAFFILFDKLNVFFQTLKGPPFEGEAKLFFEKNDAKLRASVPIINGIFSAEKKEQQKRYVYFVLILFIWFCQRKTEITDMDMRELWPNGYPYDLLYVKLFVDYREHYLIYLQAAYQLILTTDIFFVRHQKGDMSLFEASQSFTLPGLDQKFWPIVGACVNNNPQMNVMQTYLK